MRLGLHLSLGRICVAAALRVLPTVRASPFHYNGEALTEGNRFRFAHCCAISIDLF
jgi:hypothetical protein